MLIHLNQLRHQFFDLRRLAFVHINEFNSRTAISVYITNYSTNAKLESADGKSHFYMTRILSNRKWIAHLNAASTGAEIEERSGPPATERQNPDLCDPFAMEARGNAAVVTRRGP